MSGQRSRRRRQLGCVNSTGRINMRGKSQLGRIVGEQTGVQVLEVEFCRHLALKPPLTPIQVRMLLIGIVSGNCEEQCKVKLGSELQLLLEKKKRHNSTNNNKPKPKALSTGEKDRLGVNGENKREVGIVLPGNRTDRLPHGSGDGQLARPRRQALFRTVRNESTSIIIISSSSSSGRIITSLSVYNCEAKPLAKMFNSSKQQPLPTNIQAVTDWIVLLNVVLLPPLVYSRAHNPTLGCVWAKKDCASATGDRRRTLECDKCVWLGNVQSAN
ncbi:hypothetical protein T11_8971 [Trichinella zimbabwensis]|uniref:Uncharacterized protein n=1 Tax=Trichinella zimbabwensis TaxID=268475 RepID=A0A0V1HRP7_9BILA|nr:hypothetical protein T11_8971 [Trichinella zimbabwensis]